MQELAIAENLAITFCDFVLQGFENDDVQKNNKKKGHHPLFGWKLR